MSETTITDSSLSAEQQSSRFNDLMLRFVLWRQRHIKEKTFVLVLAFIVGICCGFAALLLKTLIHFISHVLTGQMNLIGGNYLYFIYPVIGILIAGWRSEEHTSELQSPR